MRPTKPPAGQKQDCRNANWIKDKKPVVDKAGQDKGGQSCNSSGEFPFPGQKQAQQADADNRKLHNGAGRHRRVVGAGPTFERLADENVQVESNE